LGSSLRVFSRQTHKNLSTLLPPPALSPLRTLRAVSYCRRRSTAAVLLDSRALYLYTLRTDPACLAAVWDLLQIQEEDAARHQRKMTKFAAPK
jgi:hypothetical protein